MRKIFLTILLCLPFSLSAQAITDWLKDYQVLDTVIFNFTYSLSWVTDPAKPDEVKQDLQTLQVGKNISNFYSKGHMDYMNYVEAFIEETKGRQPYAGNKNPTYKDEVMKNYPAGKLTFTHDDGLITGYFTYEDEVAFNWTLSEEMAEIMGYKCQKATTAFRGRDYTAWFTMEIPISNGPWKFGGLPGLIMKIEDSEQHYVFECVGIEQPKGETIKFYNTRKVEKTTRDKLYKFVKMQHDDESAFLELRGWTIKGPPKPSQPKPYNPIELDLN